MNVSFEGYRFSFWLTTTVNRYEPVPFTVTETGDGLVVRAERLTYGEGSGSTPGLFEVTFRREQDGFSWQARAAHAEPIKGIRVRVAPLLLGTFMVPSCSEFTLREGDRGRCYVYPGGYYPLRHITSTRVQPHAGPRFDWHAPFLLLRAADRTLFLHAREYPPRVKKAWLYRYEDFQEVYLYSEADACRRTGEYSAPVWHLDAVQDWRAAVAGYSGWMATAFGMRPFAQRADAQPWLSDLGLVVILHGLSHDGKACWDFASMAAFLEALAPRFPPQRTLIKVVGYDANIDRNWPDNAPSPVLGGGAGFGRFMATAHRLGFRVVPHLNVWGASFENPATKDLLAYQMCDSDGNPMTWSYDYDQDEVNENIFAYISPDAAEWRAVLRGKVRDLVERYGLDAIYFDQTGTFVNDSRHDHYRGLKALYSEIRADLPQVQFQGEGPSNEVTASLVPLVCGVSGSGKGDTLVPEMYRLLLGPYIRQYGYPLPPEPHRGVWGSTALWEWWSEGQYLAQLEHFETMGAIPSLNLTDRRINLDGKLVEATLERARTR